MDRLKEELEVKYPHEFLKRNDPEKIRLEKERSLNVKKKHMTKSFIGLEDSDRIKELLHEAYASNNKTHKVID